MNIVLLLKRFGAFWLCALLLLNFRFNSDLQISVSKYWELFRHGKVSDQTNFAYNYANHEYELRKAKKK